MSTMTTTMMTLTKETMQHINALLQQERDRMLEQLPDSVSIPVPLSLNKADDWDIRQVVTLVPDYVKAAYVDGVEELALFSERDLLPTARSSSKQPQKLIDYFDITDDDVQVLEQSGECTPEVQQAYQHIIEELHDYVVANYNSKEQIQNWLRNQERMQEAAYATLDIPYETEKDDEHSHSI